MRLTGGEGRGGEGEGRGGGGARQSDVELQDTGTTGPAPGGNSDPGADPVPLRILVLMHLASTKRDYFKLRQIS